MGRVAGGLANQRSLDADVFLVFGELPEAAEFLDVTRGAFPRIEHPWSPCSYGFLPNDLPRPAFPGPAGLGGCAFGFQYCIFLGVCPERPPLDMAFSSPPYPSCCEPVLEAAVKC